MKTITISDYITTYAVGYPALQKALLALEEQGELQFIQDPHNKYIGLTSTLRPYNWYHPFIQFCILFDFTYNPTTGPYLVSHTPTYLYFIGTDVSKAEGLSNGK